MLKFSDYLMDKYCLFLLLSSTGLPSQKLQDLLIQNPTIAENFIILRVKPPHILYELKEITHQDLPMLIFGDNVVLKGDESVMELMVKQAELGGAPEVELQADFSTRIMEKFLPALSKFEPPEEQELFDNSGNLIEDLLILILGSLVLGLPHMKEFIESNEMIIPEFPIELNVEHNEDHNHSVIDLEFDEHFLSSFWQFTLNPPKFPQREWVDFFYELYSVGLPISTLVKALGWYFGRFAVQRSDVKLLPAVQQIIPPSWGEFIEFSYDTSSRKVNGGIQLKFYFTNPYAWDLSFLAFFMKGALESINNAKLKPFNIYYNAESKYFEFSGEFPR